MNALRFTDSDTAIALEMASALSKFAISLPVSSEDQAKVMVLAWAGARDRRANGSALLNDVIKADFYLRLAEYPKEDPFFEGAPSQALLETHARAIVTSLTTLSQSSSQSSRLYAAYARDLIFRTETLPDEFIDFEAVVLDSVKWSDIMPGREEMGVSSDSIQRFAKRQSLIKGLLVMDLGGSEVAGQASQMNATVQDTANMNSITTFRFKDCGRIHEVGS